MLVILCWHTTSSCANALTIYIPDGYISSTLVDIHSRVHGGQLHPKCLIQLLHNKVIFDGDLATPPVLCGMYREGHWVVYVVFASCVEGGERDGGREGGVGGREGGREGGRGEYEGGREREGGE